MIYRRGELGGRFFPCRQRTGLSEGTQVMSKDELQKATEAAQQLKSDPVGLVADDALALPDLTADCSAPAQVTAPVEDTFKRKVALRMAFLGCGQGGGKMAQAFHDLGYRRIAAVNTTDRDFAGLAPEMGRLSLGTGGAAKDMQFAASQIPPHEEELWDLLTRSWGQEFDWAMVCASLGGGTGSGTAAPLVNLIRKYMKSKRITGPDGNPRIGAVISLPMVGEGPQPARNAVQAFQELLAVKASPIICIDNARIHELLQRPGVAHLYPRANKAVANLFHLFNCLAAMRSKFLTFDSSELSQLLGGGLVVMGAANIGKVTSPADISERIRAELGKTVQATVDIRTGRSAACVFVGDEQVLQQLSMDYFEAGFDQLDRLLGTKRAGGGNTVIHRGIYDSLQPNSGLQCYVMISELEPPANRIDELAKKAGLDSKEVKSSLASFLRLE